MNVTLSSLLTALVVSGVLSLLLILLSFQTTWVMKLGLWPLCFLLLLAGLRMWLPVELPFAKQVEVELEKSGAWLGRTLWGELSLGEGLALLWLLGALFLLGRLFAGFRRHQKQMETWEKGPEEVMQLFRRCIPQGKGDIRVAEDIKAPYVSGFFTPTIGLPPVHWRKEDLRLILLHEWQHFCNRDQWIKLMFYGFCCVFWWNPVMWLLKRQLDQLLELRCDFKVLEKLPEEERDSYYEMLLRTYRAMQGNAPAKDRGRKIGLPWPRFYRHRAIQRFRLGLNFALVGVKGRKAGRALTLAAFFVFLCSYGVVVQPVILQQGISYIAGAKVSPLGYEQPAMKLGTGYWLERLFVPFEDGVMVVAEDQVTNWSTRQVMFTLPESISASKPQGEEEKRYSAICLDGQGNLAVLFVQETDDPAWVQRFAPDGTPQGEPVTLDGLDPCSPKEGEEELESVLLPVDKMQIWGERIIVHTARNTLQIFDSGGRLLETHPDAVDFDVDAQGKLFFFTEKDGETVLHRLDCQTGREEWSRVQDGKFFCLAAGDEVLYLQDQQSIQAFSSADGKPMEKMLALSKQVDGSEVKRLTAMEDGTLCMLDATPGGRSFLDILYVPQ